MGGDQTVIAETRSWLERVVIGLELCPFAKAVHKKGLIRYFVSHACTPEALLEDLLHELVALSVFDPQVVDTTLLIHPDTLPDFLDYNDFLGVADAALEDLGFSGTLQIASFHPCYQFAGNAPDDPANFSNRSPYPMLHILREASVENALAAFPDASNIFVTNRRTLRALGADRVRLLLSTRRADPNG
jgi:hypothetical protein